MSFMKAKTFKASIKAQNIIELGPYSYSQFLCDS